MIRNVFTDDFYKSEVAKFSPITYNNNGVKAEIIGDAFFRCDGIFYANLQHLTDFPVFRIDGRLWMSITPMEVESHIIPIEIAKKPEVKTIAIGGLGLGYYLARVMGNENLEHIVVFEKEQRWPITSVSATDIALASPRWSSWWATSRRLRGGVRMSLAFVPRCPFCHSKAKDGAEYECGTTRGSLARTGTCISIVYGQTHERIKTRMVSV